MKQFYGEPELRIIRMQAEDVVRTSGEDGVSKDESDPYSLENRTQI